MSSTLSDLATAYKSLPVEGLLIGHCLLVASWYRGFRDRFLLCYWVSNRLLQSEACPMRHHSGTTNSYFDADRLCCCLWRRSGVLFTSARPCESTRRPFSWQLFGSGLDHLLVVNQLLSRRLGGITAQSAACKDADKGELLLHCTLTCFQPLQKLSNTGPITLSLPHQCRLVLTS